MPLSPRFSILYHTSSRHSFNSPSKFFFLDLVFNTDTSSTMSLSMDAWKEIDAELDFRLDPLNSLTREDFPGSWWKTDGQGLNVHLRSSPAAEPHQPLGQPRG